MGDQENKRKNALQKLARIYLVKLQGVAEKFGLSNWLNGIIEANKRGECEATLEEVDMLPRMVNDDKVRINEIPKSFGISYRRCFENDLFKKLVRNFGFQGTYSKVDMLVESEATFGNPIEENYG